MSKGWCNVCGDYFPLHSSHAHVLSPPRSDEDRRSGKDRRAGGNKVKRWVMSLNDAQLLAFRARCLTKTTPIEIRNEMVRFLESMP